MDNGVGDLFLGVKLRMIFPGELFPTRIFSLDPSFLSLSPKLGPTPFIKPHHSSLP